MIAVSFGGETRLRALTCERSFLAAVGFDNPFHRVVVDPGLSAGDAPHATYQQIWRDGARDDAANPATIELHCLVFVRGQSLHNELDVGRDAQEFRD